MAATALPAIPWPCFVLGWTRHPPRIILLASVGHTVARRALTDHAGELLAAGNGEPPRLPLFPAGALSLSLPSVPGHPILIQRPPSADTPSWVKLLKSPPVFA